MPWHYKSPLRFPATYPRILREAAASPGEPQFFLHSTSRSSLESEAQDFRWFRYCLRQDPEVLSALSAIEVSSSVKTSIRREGSYWCLFVTVRPTLLDEITALNPELVENLAPLSEII